MTSGTTVGDLGEEGVIALLRNTFGAPEGAAGIGDDAAVLDLPPGSVAFATDSMVEGVDFDLAYTSGSDLGWKVVAINVSDLAAMGAEPSHAVATLCLPGATDLTFVEGVIDGLSAAAAEWDLKVVGGDLSSAALIVMGLALLGTVVGTPILRSGARPGDAICVTGSLGGSAGGLAALQADPSAEGSMVERHRRPRARLDEARAMSRSDVTAMIDVSDGCVIDLARLLNSSEVGCRVDSAAIPLDPGLEASRLDPLHAAMFGGEDFELLFTTPAGKVHDVRDLLHGYGTPVTQIGIVTDGAALIDDRDIDRLKEESWDHLRSR